MTKALQSNNETTDARALIGAAEIGDAAAVKSLLAAGASVNRALENGETALMRAAAKGHADVLRLLLDEGADVNARRDDGFTALIVAVFFGHEDVVRLLLANGADASAQTRLGTTAEKWAASRGFVELVELLKAAEAVKVAPVEATRRNIESARHEVERDNSVVTEEILSVFSVTKVDKVDAPARSIVSSEDSEKIEEVGLVDAGRAGAKMKALPPPPSFGARVKSSLTSWPVMLVALPLVLASGIVGYVIREKSGQRINSSPSTTQGVESPREGVASQPVVPQTLPPATNAEVQPVTPGVPQDLQGASLPFGTTGPQPDIVSPASGTFIAPVSSIPPAAADKLPSAPTVLSENGVESFERGQSSSRSNQTPARVQTTLPDGGGSVERGAAGAGRNDSPQRTARQDAALSSPAARSSTDVSPVAPAPQPTPKRKVIQWP
ncbi:MAG: ankyrin repeat domain-containing protein [Pyrinomonadaceae bacterium]